MKAAIRKELREVLWVMLAPIVLIAAAWILDAGFEETLIRRDVNSFILLMLTGCGAGLLIGAGQYVREHVSGTLGYFVHRDLGHRGVFRAKTIAGSVATLAVVFVPPLVYALWERATSPNGAVIQWERVLEMLPAAPAALSAYVLAVLAMQLRRGFWTTVLLALLGQGSVLVTMGFGAGAMRMGALLLFLALHTLIVVSALWLASRLFESARDRDLPLDGDLELRTVLVSLLVYLTPLALTLGAVSWETRDSLVDGYPEILYEQGREQFRLEDEPDIRRLLTSTPHGPKAEGRHFEVAFTPSLHTVRSTPVASLGLRTWTNLSTGAFWIHGETVGQHSAYLDSGAGVIRLFDLVPEERFVRFRSREQFFDVDSPPPHSLPFERTLTKDGEGGRLSRGTVGLASMSLIRTVDRRPLSICIADPEDRSLWKLQSLDFDAPLVRLELPDGDRFVRLEPLYGRAWALQGKLTPMHTFLVAGERGIYGWNGREFERRDSDPAPTPAGGESYVSESGVRHDAGAVTAAEAEKLARWRARGFDSDALAPRVEILDAASGNVLFTHQYGPESAEDVFWSIALHADVLLRPPPAIVTGFLRDRSGLVAPPALRSMLEPALLYGRSRAWLALAALAFAVWQVRAVRRRLRARQASPGLITLWTLVVAAFGFPAFMLLLMLQPRRARKLATRKSASVAQSSVIPSLSAARS